MILLFAVIFLVMIGGFIYLGSQQAQIKAAQQQNSQGGLADLIKIATSIFA